MSNEVKELPKATLVSRQVLTLADIAKQNDTSRGSLRSLHITKDYTEATEGHVLIRVAKNDDNINEFPYEKEVEKFGENDSVNLNLETINKIAKNFLSKSSPIPILNDFLVVKDKDKTKAIVADEDNVVEIKPFDNPEEIDYPDTDSFVDMDKAMLKKEHTKVIFRLDILLLLLNTIKKLTSDKYASIEFHIDNPTKPIYVKVIGYQNVDLAKRIEALIMPQKI